MLSWCRRRQAPSTATLSLTTGTTKIHVPEVLRIPGFLRARRFKTVNAPENSPYEEFLAVYEFDCDDVDTVAGLLLDASNRGELSETDLLRWDPPPRAQVFEEIFNSDQDVRGRAQRHKAKPRDEPSDPHAP